MNSEIIETRNKKTKCGKRKQQESPEPPGKSTNRKKKVKAADNNTDEEEEKPSKQVTAYIHVSAPLALPLTSVRGRKTAQKPMAAVKGPFFFSTTDSFASFKRTVAMALPCKVKLLPIDKLQWAYEKPKNASLKPLSTEDGFKAMVLSLEERKKDLVVVLSMPPPKADDVVRFLERFMVYSCTCDTDVGRWIR